MGFFLIAEEGLGMMGVEFDLTNIQNHMPSSTESQTFLIETKRWTCHQYFITRHFQSHVQVHHLWK